MGNGIKTSWKERAIITTAKVFGVKASIIDNRVTLVGNRVGSSLTRLFGQFIGTTYVWSSYKTGDYIEKGYMGNAAVYTAVDRINSTAAISPFRAYKVKDKRKHAQYVGLTGKNATKDSLIKAMQIKEEVYEEIEGHPLTDLLEKPNRWQTVTEFIKTCIGFKLITGNRYLWVNRLEAGANAGKPVEIFNLPPQHMMIVVQNSLWEVTEYQMQLGRIVKFPAENVIHSRYWNPHYDGAGSHLYGLSPLSAASKALQRSNLAEQRGANILKNAGAEGVLFNELADDSDDSVARLAQMKKKLNEDILGVENAGRIELANGKLGYIKLGMSAEDLKIVDQEKYSDEKIYNIYKVPPGLFMSNANATDNNIKAWNKQLITQAVLPELNDLRDDFNTIAKMYPDEDLYVDFDLSVFPELQEDLEKTANTMLKCYWLTGEEKRRAMGYDDDPNEPMLKKYLVPSTLKEISGLNPENILNEVDRAIQDTGESDVSDQGD